MEMQKFNQQQKQNQNQNQQFQKENNLESQNKSKDEFSKSEEQDFVEKRDYNYNVPTIFRFFFIDMFIMMVHFKKIIFNKKNKNKKINLQLHQLPQIKESDRPHKVAQDFMKKYQQIFSNKLNKKNSETQKNKQQQQNQKKQKKQKENFQNDDELYEQFSKLNLNKKDIVKVIISTFKKNIFMVFFLGSLDNFLRIGNSFLLQKIIESIQKDDKDLGYQYCALLSASLFFSTLFRHNCNKTGQFMGGKLRLMFVNLLYKKISRLSTFQIQEANLGKLISFVSADLNQMELKFMFLFIMALSPIFLILACILMYYRMKGYGLLAIGILFLYFPVQKYMQQKSVKYYKNKQNLGDKQTKLLNDIIDGIKLIKMYAWELAFEKQVSDIKHQEFKNLIYRSFWQVSERALAKSSTFIATFVTFLVVHYQDPDDKILDSSIIFSTLEILNNMRLTVVMFFGFGIGFIFEFQSLLNRFINIMEMKEESILNIDYKYENIPEICQNTFKNQKLFKQNYNNQNDYEFLKQYQNKIPHNPYDNIQQQNDQNNINKNNNNQQKNIIIKLENNVCAFWSKNTQKQPVLKNLNLEIFHNKVYSVVGKVGSGKSSFLQLLLKEIPLFSGNFSNQNSMAYVGQDPYIFQGTVKENILFGKDYDDILYQKVIKYCQLIPDLNQFGKTYDQTFLGEKGVNLSGGQKTRIVLARALYSQADLYLFDDPLAAVDSKVAKNIFYQAIQQFLIFEQKKTVILVTHHLHFTKHCDQVIVFENGIIEAQGHFDQIKQYVYKQFSQEEIREMEEQEKKEKQIEQTQLQLLQEQKILTQENQEEKINNQNNQEEDDDFSDDNQEQIDNFDKNMEIVKSEKQIKASSQNKEKNQQKISKLNLQNKENQEEIQIGYQTYKRLFFTYNKFSCYAFFSFTLFAIAEVFFTGFYYFMGKYNEWDYDKTFTFTGICLGLYIFQCLVKLNYTQIGSLHTSKNIFQKMLFSILRTPIIYFDQNSTGQTLNRFTNDINILDNQLPVVLLDILEGFTLMGNVFITVSIVSPYVIIPTLFVGILLIFWYFWCKPMILELKRIDQVNKSPVFQFFTSTLSGMLQIRVYNQEKLFNQRFNLLTENSLKSTIVFWDGSRIFGSYTQLLGWLCTTLGSFIIVSQNGSENSALAGQSLSYYLLLTEYIQWTIRQALNFGSVMCSVERSFKIIDLKQEKPFYNNSELQNPDQINFNQDNLISEHCLTDQALNNQENNINITNNNNNLQQQKYIINIENDNKKNNNIFQQKTSIWPQKGLIQLQSVKLRYREDIDLVLKNLSFDIQPGQRVGCIGRTGAGKSSIIQALFRFVEYEGGTILYDGKNIKDLGLHTLRKNITIIPQTPFIFQGTIKKNIDPLAQFSDDQILQVLKETRLYEKVQEMPLKLNTDISDTKSVFSVGETQLICLARAILQNNPFILMDEATANIDLETDKFIQQKIKERFVKNSVFTIAHRLNTIADYDKIIVMDKGQIVEQGSPLELLIENFQKDKKYNIEEIILQNRTYFSQMVKHTGFSNQQKILDISIEYHNSKYSNFTNQ